MNYRTRRYNKNPRAFQDLSMVTGLPVGRATSLMPQSTASRMTRSYRNNLKRRIAEAILTETVAEIKAQVNWKQHKGYKPPGDKRLSYSRPGDANHKAVLRQQMSKMDNFKKKMFSRLYNDYRPTNPNYKGRPDLQSFARKHSAEYNAYTDDKMYNSQ